MRRRSFLAGSVLGLIPAAFPGVALAQSGQRSEPLSLASLRFQPVPPWVDLVRVVSDDPAPDTFRMRVSGARGGVSAFLHDARGHVLGLAGVPAVAIVEPLLDALAAREEEVFVGPPIETVLWRSRADTSTRTGAWRTADRGVNAAVEAIAGVLSPPTSTGWLVSWSPRHLGVEGRPDLTIGSGDVPDLEGVITELMAEDRLLTFVRSPAIDRFMDQAQGRFVFNTQSLDGLGLGTMLVLRT
jgi:hypothetical protein